MTFRSSIGTWTAWKRRDKDTTLPPTWIPPKSTETSLHRLEIRSTNKFMQSIKENAGNRGGKRKRWEIHREKLFNQMKGILWLQQERWIINRKLVLFSVNKHRSQAKWKLLAKNQKCFAIRKNYVYININHST